MKPTFLKEFQGESSIFPEIAKSFSTLVFLNWFHTLLGGIDSDNNCD